MRSDSVDHGRIRGDGSTRIVTTVSSTREFPASEDTAMTITSAPRPADTRPRPADYRPRPADTRARARRVEDVIGTVASWLAAHSVTALRISLGLVIFGFGALKYFPGASPAEPLVMRTVDALTFGLVSGTPAVVATAVVETLIGLTLITGIGLRVGLVALAGTLLGWMSPLLLFPGDLFPGGLPTLEAQYVLKDLILGAAAAVVAARALGARYVRDR
jgi:putative oxidoreductase